MKWLHRHQWTTIGRTFKPPKGALKSARGPDQDFILSLQFGMTTVTQRCQCGLERSYTVAGEIGDVTPTPEEG